MLRTFKAVVREKKVVFLEEADLSGRHRGLGHRPAQ